MPTWDDISKEISELNPLKIVEKYVTALSKHTGRTTICYMSAFSVVKQPVPSPFRSIRKRVRLAGLVHRNSYPHGGEYLGQPANLTTYHNDNMLMFECS